jgi:hypothetical protein
MYRWYFSANFYDFARKQPFEKIGKQQKQTTVKPCQVKPARQIVT